MCWKIVEMYRDIEASHSILYRACASADPFPDPLLAAVAKVTCNEMALRVTSEAIQVHGGYSFTDEFPVSRFYWGARYGTLGGGTSETLRDLIGRRVLAGIDRPTGYWASACFEPRGWRIERASHPLSRATDRARGPSVHRPSDLAAVRSDTGHRRAFRCV
jgi:hypothetical protein